MDLWRLHIFRNVVDCKSFSKAADAVNLSQPTISSHIKDLENHFQCKLIDRLEKQAVPTKEGELLYYYAGRLLVLYDEAEAAMNEFQGKVRGRLLIGGSTIPGGYILPQVIGEFIKAYPEVNISLIVGDTEKIVKDIANSDLELGIVGAKSGDKRIKQNKILDDIMQVIIPGDHKWIEKEHINLNQLINEPFIIRESGSGTLKSINNVLSEQGLKSEKLNIVAELGSTEAVIQGIKSKVGISILSPIAVSDALQAGTLKALSIKDIQLKRQFYLTIHKDRSASPLCKSFIKFIKKRLKKI